MPVAAKAYTQDELLSLIRKGDLAAFSIFYDTYSPAIYCVVSKSGADSKICETIFQASLIKIWENFQSFDPKKQRLLAWMLEIARDITTRALQAQKGNKNPEIQNQSNNVSKNKEVLTLIYFKGYSIDKAAKVLDVSINELKTKLKSEFDQLRS